MLQHIRSSDWLTARDAIVAAKRRHDDVAGPSPRPHRKWLVP